MNEKSGVLPEVERSKEETAETPEQAASGNIIVFDMRQLTHFRADGPAAQVLSDSGASRLVLFAFKAGQQLKEHHTSSQILVQALRGRITFNAEGKSIKLQAGMILQVEADVPHSVVAQTNAAMLLTMTPSPSSHSLGLNRDGSQGLTPLVSRITGV